MYNRGLVRRMLTLAMSGILVIPLAYSTASVAQAEVPTIHITGNQVSKASELGANVIVEPGATYTVHSPDKKNPAAPMIFNSLIIRKGGKVIHNKADNKGEMWVGLDRPEYQNVQFTEEWSGYFSPIGRNGNPSADSMCFQVGAAYADYFNMTVRFERILPDGRAELLNPTIMDTPFGEMYQGQSVRELEVRCYTGLKASEKYRLYTKADAFKRYYDEQTAIRGIFGDRPEVRFEGMALHAFLLGVGKTTIRTVDSMMSCKKTGDDVAVYYGSCVDTTPTRRGGPYVQNAITLDANPSGYFSIKSNLDPAEPGLLYTAKPYGAGDEYSYATRYSFDTKIPDTAYGKLGCIGYVFCSVYYGRTGLYGYTYQTTRGRFKDEFNIPAGLYIQVKEGLVVEDLGMIDATGMGYPGTTSFRHSEPYEHSDGYGLGGGVGIERASCSAYDWFEGGGGSHAGKGRGLSARRKEILVDGRTDAPSAYGDRNTPVTLGSGGAGSFDADHDLLGCDKTEYGDGGSGGGAIRIQAESVKMGFGSVITANGTNGYTPSQFTSGGGSGGSVLIETNIWDGPYTDSASASAGVTRRERPYDSRESDNVFGSPLVAENGLLTDDEIHVVRNSQGAVVKTSNMGNNVQAKGGEQAGGGYVTLRALTAVPQVIGSISGYVFNDMDGSAYRNPDLETHADEPFIEDGRPIQLTGITVPYSATVQTSGGRFTFPSVPAGMYKVTDPNIGTTTPTSEWKLTTQSHSSVIVSAAVKDVSDVNFGYQKMSVSLNLDPIVRILSPSHLRIGDLPTFFVNESIKFLVEATDDRDVEKIKLIVTSTDTTKVIMDEGVSGPFLKYAKSEATSSLPVGTYKVTATVYDNDGRSATDEIWIRVKNYNLGNVLNYGVGSQSL